MNFIKRIFSRGGMKKIDSKYVTKEINKEIKPYLIEQGFKSSGKTFYREKEKKIDIINFQSFSSYNAGVIGCTTFSFAINMGTYFKFLNNIERPKEYHSQFRWSLNKSINQKELERSDIWFIDDFGKNLDQVITDSKKQIINNLEKFDEFNNLDNVLKILLRQEIDMNELWGMGRINSLNRNILIAKFTHHLENKDIFQEYYDKTLKQYQDLILKDTVGIGYEKHFKEFKDNFE